MTSRTMAALACLIFPLGLVPAALLAADSFDYAVVGARAEAMGGAAIAAAEDSTALFHNPAGLAAMSCPEAQAVIRVQSDRQTIDSAGAVTKGTRYSQTAFNFLGGAYPLTVARRRLVVGFGYQRPIELVTHYRGADVDGGVVTWSPSVGMEIAPWASAGLAVNLWRGTRENDTTVDGVNVVWKSKYSGVNATVGLRFDMQKSRHAVPLRIGLVIRTPFDLDLDYHDRTTPPDVVAAWTYTAEMPWTIGVGAAYDIGDRFTVAADFENRRFGGRELISRGAEGVTVAPMSASGDDLNPLRLGAEYRLPFGPMAVPLRAGFRTVPTLYADRVDGSVTEPASGAAFTFGSGIGIGALAVDVTFSRSEYDVTTETAGAKRISTRAYTTWLIAGTYRFSKMR